LLDDIHQTRLLMHRRILMAMIAPENSHGVHLEI
jgi:hypothetical protein